MSGSSRKRAALSRGRDRGVGGIYRTRGTQQRYLAIRRAVDRSAMRLNGLGLGLAVAVVLVMPVGSASAEVRSGSVTDPTDATLHQNVDGTSYRDQDIQRVTASYDTAGSITMTFYFLDPLPAYLPARDSAPDGLS